MDATCNMDLPVLDEAYLASQTFGDSALARDVLQLFIEQCDRLALATGESAMPAEQALALHTLKGAARAVGALRLAALAEAHEDIPVPAGGSSEDRLRELRGAIEEARAAALRHGTSPSP